MEARRQHFAPPKARRRRLSTARGRTAGRHARAQRRHGSKECGSSRLLQSPGLVPAPLCNVALYVDPQTQLIRGGAHPLSKWRVPGIFDRCDSLEIVQILSSGRGDFLAPNGAHRCDDISTPPEGFADGALISHMQNSRTLFIVKRTSQKKCSVIPVTSLRQPLIVGSSSLDYNDLNPLERKTLAICIHANGHRGASGKGSA